MCNSNIYLIADSGASKTDWVILQSDKMVHQFQTQGISPIFLTKEEIATVIKNDIFPQTNGHNICKVRFYGSGCIPEKTDNVKRALNQSFKTNDIEVYSDLIAAAHALCGNQPGIVGILGTGSNSCEWNGKEIVHQIPPLGFILGDEGSGAYMGKLLIGDALKNKLTEELKEKLLEQYTITTAEILDRVYSQPFPSRFLASFVPFITQHIDEPTIKHIVEKSFSEFYDRNITHYNFKNKRINFVGSIAFYFSHILTDIANKKGFEIGEIAKSPMEGLIQYYKSTKLTEEPHDF